MFKRYTKFHFLAMTLALLMAGSLAACAQQSDSASSSSEATGASQQAGAFNVAILVGARASIVSSPEAASSKTGKTIVYLSGDKPLWKNGSGNANHYVAIFIKKNDNPVKNAQVRVQYKKAGSSRLHKLSVAMMKVANQGKQTIHYGNNVHLEPGEYIFQVTINNQATAKIQLEVK